MANLAFLKKAAPWIGTIVSTLVPGAAPFISIAAKLLSAGFGKQVDPNPQSVQNAITEAMASPEQLAKLRDIDNQFAEQMKLMDIQSAEQFEQMAVDDRANARARQIALRDRVPAILAGFVTIGFFTVLMLMFFHKIPDQGHDALMLMLGSLGTAWTGVVAYYFGSSAGSDRKTEILANGNGK